MSSTVLVTVVWWWLVVTGSGSDVGRCCGEGERHYARSRTCSPPLSTSDGSGLCRRAASVCCLRALLDAKCDAGTTMAKQRGNCPHTAPNQMGVGLQKECCECCLLAKEMSAEGKARDCEPPEAFGHRCKQTFKQCCTNAFAFTSVGVHTETTGRQTPSYNTHYPADRTSDVCHGYNECDHHCEDNNGRPVCTCRPGFTLHSDGRTCLEMDKCAEEGSAACDPEFELCRNTPNTAGGFECVPLSVAATTKSHCPPGFHNREGHCVDLNECVLGTHNCGPKFTCRNTHGSFRCEPRQCAPGMVLNPRTRQCDPVDCPVGFRPGPDGNCVDEDECAQPHACRPYERCVNIPGSHSCQPMDNFCQPGYSLDPRTELCNDVDECAERTHSCGRDTDCINLDGSFRCRCDPGYEFNTTARQCLDVNECDRFHGHVCSFNADCENVPGSFKCHCKKGFVLGRDGRSCEDVDECASGQARCEQRCTNVPGSYQCICEAGYTLAVDGHRCEDIDECQQWAGAGAALCMGGCVNTPGSYRCECPHGYEAQADQRTCKDINECERGQCSESDKICVNTLGSFKCHTKQCPPNYALDEKYKNRCERVMARECRPNDRQCLLQPQSITYAFVALPRGVVFQGSRPLLELWSPPPRTSGGGGGGGGVVRHYFELALRNATALSRTVRKASRDDFLLQRGSTVNSAIVSLRNPLDGPQDVIVEVLVRQEQQQMVTRFLHRLTIHVGALREAVLVPPV